MSTQDKPVAIAPHLWRALEVMGRDMAVEPQALVNQAVFAWLRINGYVLPGTVHEVASTPAAPAVPPVSPEVATVAARRALVDAQARPTAPEPPPAPPRVEAAPAAAPADTSPGSPRVEPPSASARTEARAPVAAEPAPAEGAAPDAEALAAVVSRIADIEADLARLARPRPAFKDEPAEDEGAAAGSDNEEAEREEEEEAAASSADEEEEDEAPPDDEPEAPVEGTVVVRSAPVVLYIEREGEDVVRVEAEQFIIGRGPTCDLIIDSPRVSREHVRLSRQGARFIIEDLGSSNGTWLGEERVQQREVESGEEYLLGNELVRLVLRGE